MRTVIIIMSSAMLIFIFTISQAFYIRFSHQMEVKNYENTTLQIPSIETTLTKSTAKQLIKDLYNTPHFYKEKDMKAGVDGDSLILIRLVRIDPNLNLHTYIITYAHELTHVKYQVMNETWVSYMTFVKLYESGNEELKYHAMVYANQVLNGGYAGTDYDVGYYILEYLKG